MIEPKIFVQIVCLFLIVAMLIVVIALKVGNLEKRVFSVERRLSHSQANGKNHINTVMDGNDPMLIVFEVDNE